MRQNCENVSASAVSSTAFRCSLQCFCRTPMICTRSSRWNNRAHARTAYYRVGLRLEMGLPPLRLFNETTASPRKIIPTMMSPLFRRFWATFYLGAWAIVTLSYWTYSILIISMVKTVAMSVFSSRILRFLELLLSHVVSDFSVASNEDTLGGSGTPFLCTSPVSAWRCVKQHLTMVESTCSLLNPGTVRMNNRFDTIRFTTPFINVFECDHRSKHTNRTSSAALRLNNLISITSRNRAEAVSIPLDVWLLPSCSMSKRVSGFELWNPLECVA